MIFQGEPADWRDLETKVAQIFAECGCEAERGRTIQTVRGEVDVDVVVYDRTRQPELLILCECKQWGQRVPRAVVHGFRTVVADAGAHLGYLISNSGFQAGAFGAAGQANVRLVTWTEFQAELYERWLSAMRRRLQPVADEVFDYMDVFHGRLGNAVDGREDRTREVNRLWERYSLFTQATSYMAMMGGPLQFPLEGVDPGDYEGPNRRAVFPDARRYFDAMFAAAPQAVAAFESFIAAHTPSER